MTPSLFHRQNHEGFSHVSRLHHFGRSVGNNYTKSGNGFDGAINQQPFEWKNRKVVQKQNTKKLEITSWRLPKEQINAVKWAEETLQVESAAKRNTACENTLAKTLQNQDKCMHERQYPTKSLLHFIGLMQAFHLLHNFFIISLLF